MHLHYNDRWFRAVAFPLPMPTAIISIYTLEGFVIAADGFDYDWEADKVTRDAVQKLFPLKYPEAKLAYSLTGSDRIQARGSDEIAFDFIIETKAATIHLEGSRFGGLAEYSKALLDALWPLPDLAKKALDTLETPPQETTIFIDGYYNGALDAQR